MNSFEEKKKKKKKIITDVWQVPKCALVKTQNNRIGAPAVPTRNANNSWKKKKKKKKKLLAFPSFLV